MCALDCPPCGKSHFHFSTLLINNLFVYLFMQNRRRLVYASMECAQAVIVYAIVDGLELYVIKVSNKIH